MHNIVSIDNGVIISLERQYHRQVHFFKNKEKKTFKLLKYHVSYSLFFF